MMRKSTNMPSNKNQRDFPSSYDTKQSTPLVRSLNSGNHQHSGEAPNGLCFPQRLFEMLNKIDQQSEEFSTIVAWHSSGMGFVVHKPDEFMSEVMPVFFRSQTKLTSFQRQLNNYGFKRIHENKSSGSLTYYHKFFLRDQPGLCQGIELKCKINNFKTAFKSKLLKNVADATSTKHNFMLKGEQLQLLLNILPKLRSSRNGTLANLVERVGYHHNTSASLSSADFFQEGDSILDAAAAEVCGHPADDSRVESQQSECLTPSSICDYDLHGTDNSFVLEDGLWDTAIESLDTFEEI